MSRNVVNVACCRLLSPHRPPMASTRDGVMSANVVNVAYAHVAKIGLERKNPSYFSPHARKQQRQQFILRWLAGDGPASVPLSGETLAVGKPH
jgi:hypothetical protein